MPRAKKIVEAPAAPANENPAALARTSNELVEKLGLAEQLPKPWWSGGPLDCVREMVWHVAVNQVPDGECVELLPGKYSEGSYTLMTTRPHRFDKRVSAGAALMIMSGWERLEQDPEPAPVHVDSTPAPAEAPQDPKQFLTTIELDRIEITGWNPRKDFDAEELQGLADSIKAEGLRDPIKVRPKCPEFSGRFQLVDGERRLRAHRLLGWTTIRAIVEDMDDSRVKMEMLISTLQRAELKPMEIAEALQAMLAEDKDLTQEALAARIGKSQGWISNHLRLLRAPDDLQKLIISGEITPRHAQVLMPYAGYPAVYGRAKDILITQLSKGGITVDALAREVESVIANDYLGERVLNFTDPAWHHQKLLPHMDKEGCKGCEDRKEVQLGNKKCLICFKTSCFKEKLEAAEQVKADARAAELKDMKEGKAPINTDLLSYGEYDRLSLASFDKTACQECPHRRVTATEVEICMDPVCFKAKKTAKTKADNKAERDLKTQAKVAAEAHAATRSGPLNVRELRLILEVFAKSDDFDPDWLEHWTGPDAAEEVDLLEDLIDFVPDEDLPKALMFVVLRRECEHYDADHAAIIAAIGELNKPSTHKTRKKVEVREDAGGEVTEGDEEESESDVDPEFVKARGTGRCLECDEWTAPGEGVPGCTYDCTPEAPAEVKGYGCPDEDGESYGTLPAARDAFGCDECPAYLNQACRGPSKQFGTANIAPGSEPEPPIKIEGEPYPDSQPWNIADDPIQGAHMP